MGSGGPCRPAAPDLVSCFPLELRWVTDHGLSRGPDFAVLLAVCARDPFYLASLLGRHKKSGVLPFVFAVPALLKTLTSLCPGSPYALPPPLLFFIFPTSSNRVLLGADNRRLHTRDPSPSPEPPNTNRPALLCSSRDTVSLISPPEISLSVSGPRERYRDSRTS